MSSTQRGNGVMQVQQLSQKSRVWIAPDLLTALAAGKTFDEWLDGRIPVGSKARISADQKKDAHGVKAQHAANERGAKKHNLAIVKYYEDNDKSAAKANVVRPAFEMLVTELTARRTAEGFPIRGVACLERERIYRRAGDWERLTDALTVNRNGVLYESGTRRDRFIDIYADSSEMEGLTGVASAKREVRKTSERCEDAHMERRLQGISTGGPRRFGYLGPDVRKGRRSNEKKNRTEWPHLKWMIKQGAAGRAWTKIAEELNAKGVRTATGGAWKTDTVRKLVSNPIIYGYRILDDDLIRDENGEPLNGNWDRAGTAKQYQAVMERIRLARAQKGLPVEGDADFSPGSPATRTRKYLFSGFLRCGRELADGRICDQKWSGHVGRPGEKRKYDCHRRGNGYGCGSRRDGESVDAHLTELVLRRYEEMEARQLEAEPEAWEGIEELAEAREEVAELLRQRRAKNVSRQFFYQELPRLEADVTRLEAQERKHAARQHTVKAKGPRIRERWNDMDLAQKRAAIGEVLIAVIVDPLPKGTWTRAPFDPDLLTVVWRTTSPDASPESGHGTASTHRAA
ncbi:recombinase family protein [Nonomuraea typhae]|uniref:Recombinase family protein n=1 Tax=Nonomuraea typhae TaxID=2603600 RepID=A0ABW7YJV8_9ACTN